MSSWAPSPVIVAVWCYGNGSDGAGNWNIKFCKQVLVKWKKERKKNIPGAQDNMSWALSFAVVIEKKEKKLGAWDAYTSQAPSLIVVVVVIR